MPEILEREISRGLPPYRLVAGLSPAGGVRALDAATPEGWASTPGAGEPRSSLLAIEPEIEFRGGIEALADGLRWLDPDPSFPRSARVLLGHLSYELGRAFEVLPGRSESEPHPPDVCLAGYRAVYLYDPERGTGRIVGSDPAAVGRLAEQIREAVLSEPAPRPLPRIRPPQAQISDEDYRHAIGSIHRWIRAGDVYQVNLARRLDLDSIPASRLPLMYAELVRRTPAPFCAYLQAGDHVVVSNSPERFMRVSGRHVETCPIKGTRPRGITPEEDRWLAKELLSSPKDRAEHVMIVDLERNDLGRVCEIGSIQVAQLASLRSFPTVHHLVSSVQGVLREGTGPVDLLRATFPGGSITGAPKIRAMEIIEALEPCRRGVYTGAIGYFDAAGDLDLSIAIRTAVAIPPRLSLHVGGGIVADSDADSELGETWDKATAFGAFWAGA